LSKQIDSNNLPFTACFRKHKSLHPLKRYYRVDEVAVYLAISVGPFTGSYMGGDLQATRIRGCLRVSEEDMKIFEASLMDGNML